jgi:WD40 repeat protein
LVAVASDLWGVRVWTVHDGSLVYLLGEEYGRADVVEFSSDGSLLGSAGRIWSVSDGSMLHSLDEGSGFIGGASFSPDGSLVAILKVGPQSQGFLGLWSAEEGSMVRQLETMDCGEPNYCPSTFFAAFSPDRTTLLTADDTGKVKVWGFQD